MFNVQCSIFILHFALVPLATAAEPSLAVPVDGEPFRAELTGAEAGWRLTFRADQRQRSLPAADLVRWGRCPEQGRRGGLVLADGGLLSADVLAAEGKKLTAESELFGKISLPLESLAGVVLHPPSDRQQHDALLDRIEKLCSPLPLGEGPGVRALLDNGDELTGLLDGIAEGVVKFQTDVGPVNVETDRIVALIFHPIKPRPSVAPEAAPAGEKPAPLRAWIGLSDGSRLLSTRLTIDGGSATIDSTGRTWKTSAENLVFLQPLGGRAVYLSDLKPAEYRQTPYLDLTWPWRADRNVNGGRLRCGGQLFLKGIGVHSAAQLVFSPLPLGEGPGIDNKNSPLPLGEGRGVRAKRFQALIGIDDATDGRGSVRFRVLVDGRERYVSPILRGGDPPVPVSVELSGAKRLELVVDYADRADVLDHADWLDARIVE